MYYKYVLQKGVINLVHKRYIKRGGKVYGPYFYKTVRDEKGRVKNIYLGNQEGEIKEQKKVSFSLPYLELIAIIFVLGFFMLQYNYNSVEQLKDNVIGTNKQFLSVTGLMVKETAQEGSFSPIYISSGIENLKEEFAIKVGQPFNLKVSSKLPEAAFSDGTSLFDVSSEGEISFTPKKGDIGRYITTIFADGKKGKFEYKVVQFRILE